MSDAAFASAPYAGYTDKEIKAILADTVDLKFAGRLHDELHRR